MGQSSARQQVALLGALIWSPINNRRFNFD
jgi:hypothetical protein